MKEFTFGVKAQLDENGDASAVLSVVDGESHLYYARTLQDVIFLAVVGAREIFDEMKKEKYEREDRPTEN